MWPSAGCKTCSFPPCPVAPAFPALAPLCQLCNVLSTGPHVASTSTRTHPMDAYSSTNPSALSSSGLPVFPWDPALSSPDTLSQRSALCATRQLWHHRKAQVKSLPSPLLSWQRGSCPLRSASEGDCPCALREGRQKRRHGNARSGPEDMENSIGCSAGWGGRETPEGSEAEKRCCTHSLAVPGPRALHPWASGTRPHGRARTLLLRSWWGMPPQKHPWVEPAFPGPSQHRGCCSRHLHAP